MTQTVILSTTKSAGQISEAKPFYSYLKTCQTIGSFWLTCWSTKGTRKFKKVLKKACNSPHRCYTIQSSQGTVPYSVAKKVMKTTVYAWGAEKNNVLHIYAGVTTQKDITTRLSGVKDISVGPANSWFVGPEGSSLGVQNLDLIFANSTQNYSRYKEQKAINAVWAVEQKYRKASLPVRAMNTNRAVRLNTKSGGGANFWCRASNWRSCGTRRSARTPTMPTLRSFSRTRSRARTSSWRR